MTSDFASSFLLALPAPATLASVWSNIAISVGVVFFLVISIVMVLVVLIQKPQGGGLSGAFGSDSGSGQTAFGAKTGDVLTTITVGVFLLFVVTASVLNLVIKAPSAVAAPTDANSTQGTDTGAGTSPPTTPPETAPAPGTPTTPGSSDPAATPPATSPASSDTPVEGGSSSAPAETPGETPSDAPSTPPTNPGR